METFGAALTAIINALALLVPVLPYVFIVLVSYSVMGRLIKPWIRSHKLGEKFTSQRWAMADRFLFAYPILIGIICFVIVKLSFHDFHDPVFYAIFASMVSTWVFNAGKQISIKHEIAVPSELEGFTTDDK